MNTNWNIIDYFLKEIPESKIAESKRICVKSKPQRQSNACTWKRSNITKSCIIKTSLLPSASPSSARWSDRSSSNCADLALFPFPCSPTVILEHQLSTVTTRPNHLRDSSEGRDVGLHLKPLKAYSLKVGLEALSLFT